MVDAYLTKKIVDADKACQDYEKKTGLRHGYMGHLTLVAEEISKFKEYIDEMKLTFCNTAVSDRLEEPFWKEYSETILADTREKYNTVLGDFGNDQESDDDVIRNSDSEDIIGDTEGNENYGNGENDELLSNGHDSGNMDLYYNFNNNENEENEEDYAEYSDVDNKNY